jgi:hypothetical protein
MGGLQQTTLMTEEQQTRFFCPYCFVSLAPFSAQVMFSNYYFDSIFVAVAAVETAFVAASASAAVGVAAAAVDVVVVAAAVAVAIVLLF